MLDQHLECYRCERTLDLSHFTPSVIDAYRTGNRAGPLCKLCHRTRQKGIDYETFLRMYEEQNRQCGSCKNEFPMETLHIDHDHRCCPRYRRSDGKRTNDACGFCVRGLLCKKCNRALGVVELEFSEELDYLFATMGL